MVENTSPYYRLNTTYSITINPHDKYQFFDKEDRHIKFFNYWHSKSIDLLNNEIDYYLVMEISEPHNEIKYNYSGPRLHFHGWIRFRSARGRACFLLYCLGNIAKHAYTSIDTIEDNEVWYDYCHKQNIFKNRILTNYINYETFIKTCRDDDGNPN